MCVFRQMGSLLFLYSTPRSSFETMWPSLRNENWYEICAIRGQSNLVRTNLLRGSDTSATQCCVLKWFVLVDLRQMWNCCHGNFYRVKSNCWLLCETFHLAFRFTPITIDTLEMWSMVWKQAINMSANYLWQAYIVYKSTLQTWQQYECLTSCLINLWWSEMLIRDWVFYRRENNTVCM
jgi:hypothetical protein